MSNKFKLVSTVLSLVMSAVAAPSYAALTFVYPEGGDDYVGNGIRGSERCLIGPTCSGGAYDGTVSIVRALEMDMGMAAGSFTRVDDRLDQLWTVTGGQLMARVRYASETYSLGYYSSYGTSFIPDYFLTHNPSSSVYVENPGLFSTDPHASDFVATGSLNWTTIPIADPTRFAFVYGRPGMPVYFDGIRTSTPNNYPGGANVDHMVTYRIGENHYLLAWESGSPMYDQRDFNEFVVEVNFVAPVPLPAAIFLFGPALLGLIGLARRRAATV